MTRDWAQRLYWSNALVILGKNPQVALDETENPARAIEELWNSKHAKELLDLGSSKFEVDLISFWIMNRLDEDYAAALCSSSGNLLRANHPILFHPDQFFYFHLRFPLREMGELSYIFTEYDAGRMTGRDLWDRYCCLDGDTGAVKLRNQTKRQFIQYFGEYPDYNTDGGLYEKYVKPFLNWFVVFDPSVIPENLFDVFETFSLLNDQWTVPGDGKDEVPVPKKRGPKPAPAKREFESRYPDGLPEGLSADAVAAELTEAGFPITGRSVQNYDRYRKIEK